MTTQMTATIKSKMHRVKLAIENGPSITDAFGERKQIAEATLTYSNGALTAVQLEAGDVSVFVAEDLTKRENWPAWLYDLILEYA